ncbi:hypothetical protein [Nocardia brasiliensis]|uniref:hypothetical protein n=1 Tax=Nocardia brasiliensis TaxID=37326 RepID=UPI0024550160|nr:hypothetical protein [Nocardia brasiliensis]
MAWFEVYERDVNGTPGQPWPTKPRRESPPEPPAETTPSDEAEPPEGAGAGTLGLALDALRATVAAVRR